MERYISKFKDPFEIYLDYLNRSLSILDELNIILTKQTNKFPVDNPEKHQQYNESTEEESKTIRLMEKQAIFYMQQAIRYLFKSKDYITKDILIKKSFEYILDGRKSFKGEISALIDIVSSNLQLVEDYGALALRLMDRFEEVIKTHNIVSKKYKHPEYLVSDQEIMNLHNKWAEATNKYN